MENLFCNSAFLQFCKLQLPVGGALSYLPYAQILGKRENKFYSQTEKVLGCWFMASFSKETILIFAGCCDKLKLF